MKLELKRGQLLGEPNTGSFTTEDTPVSCDVTVDLEVFYIREKPKEILATS